jgi:hypothetical protein
MPCSLARTSSATTAMLNSTCAAITAHAPISRRMFPASGLTASKADTKAMSVEMPMTMPGTMMAM